MGKDGEIPQQLLINAHLQTESKPITLAAKSSAARAVFRLAVS